MSFRSTMFALSVAFVAPSACSSPLGAPPAAPPVAPDIASRGQSVYFGAVFPLRDAGTAATYTYERRVDDQGDTQTSTHVTRDPSGAIVLAESAVHSRDYALQSYSLHGNQLGQTGRIDVAGDRVTFRLEDEAGVHTKVERQSGTVVVGPTLVGTIVRNLDALRAGKTAHVRMAVLDRMETIGFDLALGDGSEGETHVVMKPSSFFVRLAVQPIHFTFDTATKNLVRLEGRVPPKVWKSDRFADFDARVEYTFVAPTYR